MKYYYNKIIEENIKYINNELDLNWNKKYIINKSIDKLYKDIIEKLLLNNKLEEYDYIYNIINQLELESINITNKIFNAINDLLNRNENIKNRYLITKEEDLFNIKIINFYYILFKYILKDSIFIYQINFLLKIKKSILKLIRLM